MKFLKKCWDSSVWRNWAQFLVFLTFVTSGKVAARPYNYADIPMGEKSFGMGGASMAISGDVGQIFYNPAALADLSASQIAAALSAYTRNDTRTGQFVSLFQSAAENISRGGFLAIPSMVGGNVRWGEWVWGGAVLVPDSFQNSGTVDISATDSAVFEAKFQSLWLGAFLARRWENNAFGISIFYANRGFDEKYFFVYGADTNPVIRFLQSGQSINGLVTVLGGVRYFGSDFKLGYSFRPPPLPLGGNIVVGDAISNAGAYDRPNKLESNFYPLPMRVSLGFGWEPLSRWSFALDLHYFTPLKGNMDRDGLREEFEFDANEVLNIFLGAEYFPWAQLGFRSGVFSNMSGAKRIPTALSAIYDRVHMFGATAGIVFDKASGSISIGGYIQGGQGRSLALDLSQKTVPRSNFTYGAVIGSSYKF